MLEFTQIRSGQPSASESTKQINNKRINCMRQMIINSILLYFFRRACKLTDDLLCGCIMHA